MTTIVAVQGDNFAVVASDSRISTIGENGSTSHAGSLGNGISKVFSNGKYLLGAAGDLRAINILTHIFSPPPAPVGLRGKKLDHFITSKFIPSLRACFDSQGYSAPDNMDSKRHHAEHDSTVIAVVNATVYIIDGDYSWFCDSSGLYALGSGSDYGLGALNALCGSRKLSPIQAKAACLKAVSIAAKLDPGTGAPYHTFIQTSDQAPASSKKATPAKKEPNKKK